MHAIFLDRDGVICENRSDHVKTWQEFQFLPGVKSSLAALSQLSLPIVVVTNQAVINRGLASAEAIEEIHQRMVAEVKAAGGRIDRVLYCPHRPDESCQCRKPEPGMLIQAAQEMGLELSRSYMVGDAASDLLAGQQVGCQAFLVLTGRGSEQLKLAFQSVNHHFFITHNLPEAACQIIKAEQADRNTLRKWGRGSETYLRVSRPVSGRLS